MVQKQEPERIAIGLMLTAETGAILDELLVYKFADKHFEDGTRAGMALTWLLRWSRREEQGLNYHDLYGPGTEPLTVAAPFPVWSALNGALDDEHTSVEALASAVVNDAGNQMAWKKIYGRLK